VSNHHRTHVLTYLARMARFYDGWFNGSPNSIRRDRAHPIAPIQADFQSYGQGLQNFLIVSIKRHLFKRRWNHAKQHDSTFFYLVSISGTKLKPSLFTTEARLSGRNSA